MKVLNLKNNSLQGFAPQSNQVIKPNETSLSIISLDNNSFLCHPDSNDLFDCNILSLDNVSTTPDNISVGFHWNDAFDISVELGLAVRGLETEHFVST